MRALLIQHGCEAALEVIGSGERLLGETDAAADLDQARDFHHTNTFVEILLAFMELGAVDLMGMLMATLNFKEIKESLKAKNGVVCAGRLNGEDRKKSNRVTSRKADEPRLQWFDFMTILIGDDGDEHTGSGSARFDPGFRMFIPHDTQVRVQLRDGSSFVLNNVRVVLLEQEGILRILFGMAPCMAKSDGRDYQVAGKAKVQTRSIWKVQRVEAISRESDWMRDGLDRCGWIMVWSSVNEEFERSSRTSHRRSDIEKKIPMEMWSGHLRDYGMLRIFGYVAYPHDKQDDKSVKNYESCWWELQRVLINHTPESWLCDRRPCFLFYFFGVRRTRTKALRFRDESNIGLRLRVFLAAKLVFPYSSIICLLQTKVGFLNLEEVIYMKQPPGFGSEDAQWGCKRAVTTDAYITGVMHQVSIYLLLYVEDLFVCFVRAMAEIGVLAQGLALKKVFDIGSGGGGCRENPNGKSVQMPLGGHFKLSLKDCPVRDCVVGGFVDSDYAKDPDKGRSITGYAFLVQGCVVSWNGWRVVRSMLAHSLIAGIHVFHERTKHIQCAVMSLQQRGVRGGGRLGGVEGKGGAACGMRWGRGRVSGGVGVGRGGVGKRGGRREGGVEVGGGGRGWGRGGDLGRNEVRRMGKLVD
ncbi:hypothetical protein Tco_0855946 [Tanacetum coccineum]